MFPEAYVPAMSKNPARALKQVLYNAKVDPGPDAEFRNEVPKQRNSQWELYHNIR